MTRQQIFLGTLLLCWTNLPVQSQEVVDASNSIVWSESRSSFVSYPAPATELLAHELNVIKAPLGLDVTVSLGQSSATNTLYSQLKGLVHRFRKQNQIIHVNPHYFLATGVEYGCRELQNDEDGAAQPRDVQILPISDQCARDCTNGGRYCLAPEDDTDNSGGASLVEETLFRICFANIYHASDLRFWEYMETYDALQCHQQASNNTSHLECSFQALESIPHAAREAIENCMHLAGGTTDDAENVHLKFEVDQRTTESSTHYYSQQDVPIVFFGDQKYPGDLLGQDNAHTAGILQFVCQVYQEKSGILPLACDFCSSCIDTRRCLWLLECDGQPFDVALLGHGNIPATSTTENSPYNGSMINDIAPPADESVIGATNIVETPVTLPTSVNIEVDGEGLTEGAMDTNSTDSEDNSGIVLDFPMYGPVVIAGSCVLVIVVIFLVVQEHRVRRQRRLTERYTQEKQARWVSRNLYDNDEDLSPRWATTFATNGASSIRGSATDRGLASSIAAASTSAGTDPLALRPSQRLQMAADLNYSTDWLIGYAPNSQTGDRPTERGGRRPSGSRRTSSSSRRNSGRRSSGTPEGLDNISIF